MHFVVKLRKRANSSLCRLCMFNIIQKKFFFHFLFLFCLSFPPLSLFFSFCFAFFPLCLCLSVLWLTGLRTAINQISVFIAPTLSFSGRCHVGMLFTNKEQKKAGSRRHRFPSHVPARFMTLKTQPSGHKMAAPTAVFLPL